MFSKQVNSNELSDYGISLHKLQYKRCRVFLCVYVFVFTVNREPGSCLAGWRRAKWPTSLGSAALEEKFSSWLGEWDASFGRQDCRAGASAPRASGKSEETAAETTGLAHFFP